MIGPLNHTNKYKFDNTNPISMIEVSFAAFGPILLAMSAFMLTLFIYDIFGTDSKKR
ncbi:MAG: hypothetical protein MJY54_02375 [archaeon]|nr:hypothetical protein [archaeon]